MTTTVATIIHSTGIEASPRTDNSNENSSNVHPFRKKINVQNKIIAWKEYLKSPMGMTWIGLILSFAATVFGLHMILTTDFQSTSQYSTTHNVAGMDLNTTKEYWLTTYSLLFPSNSNSPPIIPGSTPWNAIHWLTISDPLAPLSPDDRLIQRYALACLYFHWDGPNWLFTSADAGWLHLVAQAAVTPDGTVVIQAESMVVTEESSIKSQAKVPFHECDWLGVTCNSQEQIIALDFKSASFLINGNVPSELGLLSQLTSLDLSGKSLSGLLPPNLPSALSALTYLDLENNQFNVINDDWAAWSNLETVNLAGNSFQGELPSQPLSQWTNMRTFNIQGTSVTGNFWQNILVHWPLIENLEISYTELSGSIPEVTKDGFLSRLQTVYASRTPLTGTLPVSLSFATDLRVLQLSDISATGMTPSPFPSEFGRLTKLEVLGLSSATILEGPLPTEIGLMTSLQYLNLYSNRGLNGTIPTEIANLEHLEILRLCYTSLSGLVPEELGALSNLGDIQLHQTNLVGTFPLALCDSLIGVRTANCGVLRENDTPDVECKPGCCECYT